MTDYEHIPVWLRLTNRHLINDNYQNPVDLERARLEAHRKLGAEDIREIRRSVALTHELAELYGVSEKTIWRIRAGGDPRGPSDE